MTTRYEDSVNIAFKAYLTLFKQRERERERERETRHASLRNIPFHYHVRYNIGYRDQSSKQTITQSKNTTDLYTLETTLEKQPKQTIKNKTKTHKHRQRGRFHAIKERKYQLSS
jgi:hypothetical protein